MNKWENVIKFITKNGVRLDKLRINNALDLPYKNTEVKDILSDYQFSNGSWDYQSSEESLNRIELLSITAIRIIRTTNNL